MTFRVRALDPNGDYSFGLGRSQFLVDSPDAVAQSIRTRLDLKTGDWFLDLDEDTPYSTKILGEGTRELYDQAIRERILSTPGVLQIDQYVSRLEGRALSVTARVTTQFGIVTISQVI